MSEFSQYIMTQNQVTSCNHSAICCTSSPHAIEVGYKRPSNNKRLAATRPTKGNKGKKQAFQSQVSPETFPAPLLLPGDDLSLDPEYPTQSFQEWVDEDDRNEVTADRNVIYVVPPPEIDVEMRFVQKWDKPQKRDKKIKTSIPIQEIVEYLAAFYHGLPVKLLLSPNPRIVAWENAGKPSKPKQNPRYIGLDIGSECVRIRTRTSPDGLFARQLNLDDLLDAAISMLPNDAYALLFLVDYDLYEDEDDGFVCGRAYGGSRVAVISSARYNPDLDTIQSVDQLHMWPASHCQDYVSSCCSNSETPWVNPTEKASTNQERADDKTTPLKAALSTYSTLPDANSSRELLSALWLGRVCRTASHELGHCFGIDHCVYYACVMQGSTSVAEDSRQPPYVCPIDLSKILKVTGTTAQQRYLALLNYCCKARNQETHIFSSFAAWIRIQLSEMEI